MIITINRLMFSGSPRTRGTAARSVAGTLLGIVTVAISAMWVMVPALMLGATGLWRARAAAAKRDPLQGRASAASTAPTVDVPPPLRWRREGARRRRSSHAGAIGVLTAIVVVATVAPAQADDWNAPAEPTAPEPTTEAAAPTGPAAAASAGDIDTTSRASVRGAYDDVYAPLVSALADATGYWSGSTASCAPGTVSAEVKDDMLAAVNFYRSLAGVAPVSHTSTLDTNAQAAALIIDANATLSHEPPSSWDCWTAPGSTGAANSNLYLGGGSGPVLIDGLEAFMDEEGDANALVGHRRWLLWPSARPIGLGATESAVAVWVTGEPGTDTDAPEYVAWPGAGYWPVELSTDRWSLSHSDPDADLSNATVAMEHDGEALDIVVHNSDAAYGYLPSVTWDVTDPVFDDLVGSGSDISFTVSVSGIDTGQGTTSHGYTVTLAGGGVSGTEAAAFSGSFSDDDGSLFEADIEKLAGAGITLGCNPPANTEFCPDSSVTRGEMAAFLVRALDLTGDGAVVFADDDASQFEADIEKLAGAGITVGCNPPANTEFCPDGSVTRGQMAAFLVRALGLTDTGGVDFADDDASQFEADIEKLAGAGITVGCNPPANTEFCPDGSVTRGQMAAFLVRAGLAG